MKPMPLIEKYQLVFDISPVPMVLVSRDGEILLANSGFVELFEYSLPELTGMSVETLVPDGIRPGHANMRRAYHRSPTKRSMGAGRDLFGLTKSKTVVPLELGLEPIDHDGETMALVIALDIRARKAHESRMHQAMDAAASAMVMVNQSGTVVFANRATSALFGYNEHELLGKNVEMLVPQEYRAAHPSYTSDYVKTAVPALWD